MDDWEKDWRRERDNKAAEEAKQKAAVLERLTMLSAAFPEKRDSLIDKLESFALRWNAEDAKSDPSKQITFSKVRDDLCRLSTTTSRLLTLRDGSVTFGFPEIDIEFDQRSFIVKSVLQHNELATVISLEMAEMGRAAFFLNGDIIQNGAIIGHLLKHFLPFIRP